MDKRRKRTQNILVRLSPSLRLIIAYPTDGIHGHRCPAEFPKKLPTIQFETAFDANLFPFTPGRTNWVLANGDTTGFGIHGDFMNGWDGMPIGQDPH